MKKEDLCYRSYAKQEFRADEDDNGVKTITGHPAVFDSPADIAGMFQETIERGAFDGCDMTDVLLFVNHDMQKIPLARSRRNNGNSTMKLSIDDTGLVMTARLDTDTNPEARAVYGSIARGDMDGMSFCFKIDDDEWEDLDSDYPVRRIKKISKVFEVSAVNMPAYPATDISARDAKTALDNARKAVDTARSQSVDTDNVEIMRLKTEILAKE